MIATHPTEREISEFLLGKLDGSSVESHLAECDPCRERATSVKADDTLTDLLASAGTKLNSERAIAATPTLDGAATPPAFAPTLAWTITPDTPGANATGLTGLAAEVPQSLANHPKYRVLRQLGTGGMGMVWLAEHQVMNRHVAVKVIRPDLLARPGATGRFLREVRAAAKLHHPNIVTAFDAEPVGDSCLLVMEYVPGETLGERVQAGPLPIAEACRAMCDAARGLAHAHAHGLVHRDVKPHNLIRGEDGVTKVLDFGLAGCRILDRIPSDGDGDGEPRIRDFGLAGISAREVVVVTSDELTGPGMIVGTPAYIAPEQIVDPRSADARADIYGLGCTLYHLLAGRPPVPEGSVTDTLAFQREHVPDAIPNLPAELARALTKMLAKRPEDRYQSADEVVAALKPFIGEVTRVKRRCWDCTKNPWAIAASVAFALIVVVGSVVFKIQRDNQEITITTDDADIEVVMKRKGEVVRVIDKKSGQQWEIDTVKNEIAQADRPEGLLLKIPDDVGVVLKRHDKTVFTVNRLAKSDAAAAIASATGAEAIERFLKLVDERNFAQCWEESALTLREAVTKREFVRDQEAVFKTLGALNERTSFGRQSAGDQLMHIFKSHYTIGDCQEVVTAVREKDKLWRVLSYQVHPRKNKGPSPASGDFARLQGTWNSMTLGGSRVVVTIQDGRFTLRRTLRAIPSKEEVHPEIVGEILDETTSNSPARFRIVGSTTPACVIYRVDGDQLLLCIRKTEKSDDYPTTFATNPGKKDELVVLKRAAAMKVNNEATQGDNKK